MFNLTDEEIRRYSRQLVMEGFGGNGQKKLKESSVLIIGLGGLGSSSSYYLTAAGIGRIGLVDNDSIDVSNLHRQILYKTKDIGMNKLNIAKKTLKDLNPNTKFDLYNEFITPKNARKIIRKYDFVIDGTDNFASKFIINDACITENKPFTIAGVIKFQGQISTTIPGESACYRCIYKEPPPPDMTQNCSQAGVFGIVPGLAGIIQAGEAIRYFIDKKNNLLLNKILFIDLDFMNFKILEVKRNDKCPACGENKVNLLKSFNYRQDEYCRM
ncbi:MAG: HesA/MoeB/ThiF family protein [Candidatus Helarchaeota archaeon]